MDITEILKERGEQYGEAWKISSELMDKMLPKTPEKPYDHDIRSSLYFYPWVMILGKLARAIANPNFLDNWRDIIGYATLVLNDLESRNINHA